MRIVLTLDVDDPDLIDPTDETGVTNEAYEAIVLALTPYCSINDWTREDAS